MRTNRWCLIPVLVALLAALLAPAASAHDHAPPKSFLITDRAEQRGSVYVTEWAYGDGNFCVVGFGDGIRSWPEPIPFTPGEPMAIRLMKAQRPSKVKIQVWRLGLPVANEPLGPAEGLSSELHRARQEGRRVWEARFEPPLAADLYFDVVVTWEDEDGCGHQRVYSTFHARIL